MTRNLWIGTPGSGLREITQAARSWDRTADLGMSEFRSLDGTVTLSRTRYTPRRAKLSWEWLTLEDARHLDGLARRITSYGPWSPDADSPGPIAFIDPAAGNLLGALQSTGRCGPRDAEQGWFTVSGTAAYERHHDSVGATASTAETVLGWRHGTWPGWPVKSGMNVSWLLPSYWEHLGTAVAQLDWKDASGEYLSSSTSAGPTVTGTAPGGAVFVTPAGKPGVAKTLVDFIGACLTIGEPARRDMPGDGCPAMAVTSYTDTPAPRLPYRNMSVDLVEVNGAVR
ncbi:hypothetical protein [Streptomyces zagrosensis]|uniref:Uncharacterized protein n=1 Tax=Streptomyces zagrosensis TaxID=1042984 RepID=A0A7W9QGX5_9ACTN|nr:hypothetical protein [Streptomyces zagrosensis]MBB5940076.1 hypothetical protein [Streptomyces zagrosensis]